MRIPRTTVLALAALLAGTPAAAAAAAGPAPATSCGGTTTLALTQTFSQPAYHPGQTVTVTVSAVNCTGQTLTTHVMPYGQFADASGGRAAGCAVIDPLWNPVTIDPHGTSTTSYSYTAVAGCLATQFIAYDNFYNADGSLLAAGTAAVPIVPAVACHVGYTNQGEWAGGFTAAISITDTGPTAIDGWTLKLDFGGDQKAGNVWGATATQSGRTLTLTNLPWDATIAPGATSGYVGLTGTWSASDAAPTGFAVNGVTCG